MNLKKIVVVLVLTVVVVFVVVGLLFGNKDGVSEKEIPTVKSQVQVIEDITLREANSLIKNNKDSEKFVIIDLRTPEEYIGGHVEDAENLDYYSNTFQNQLEELDKDETYLIYCQSGRRSTATLEVMKELGFNEVYNLTGGISRWQAEGLPVTK